MDTKSYPEKYVLSRYTFLGGGAGGFGLALLNALLFKDAALLDEIFAYSVYGIFIGMIPSFIAGMLMAAFRVRRGVKGTLAPPCPPSSCPKSHCCWYWVAAM